MQDRQGECECTTEGPDGYIDLTLKFKTQGIVATLGEVEHKDELLLTLKGELFEELGGTPIVGADCIAIRGKYKPFNEGDLNKDGVVNSLDFAIIAENWLQSCTFLLRFRLCSGQTWPWCGGFEEKTYLV